MLASASPRRVDLLAQINITPSRIIAANIDETPRPREVPRALAKRLAFEKAAAIAMEEQDALVLAADTVVGVGRRILPKTESVADARACLQLMSGRGHRVHSGICLMQGARHWQRVVTSRVQMRRLGAKILRLIWRPVNGRAKPAAMPFKVRSPPLSVKLTALTAILSVCPCLRRPICYKLLASDRAKDYFPQKSEI